MLSFLVSFPLHMLRMMAAATVGGSILIAIYLINAGRFRPLDAVFTGALVIGGSVVYLVTRRLLRHFPSPV